MAEYLTPGVYVEEFDSGVKAMEGVGTSTAGFVGMAAKGPVFGMPVLITSMADYQRQFGGYLPEQEYGDRRFLPYAVEQFFNNGGSACYVMRVCREQKADGDGGATTAAFQNAFLSIAAASPGAWGNTLRMVFVQNLKNRTRILAIKEQCYTVEAAQDYAAGDMVYIQLSGEKKGFYTVIASIADSQITVKWPVDVNKAEGAELFLYLVEWELHAQDETASEGYESVSFNGARANYLAHATADSRLFTQADVSGDKLKKGVMEQLLGEQAEFTVTFSGGEDGNAEFSADLYMGTDNEPDRRTGLKAFESLSDVSIMAIPGITDRAVQSALVTQCESLGNRFAILDMPLDSRDVEKLQEFRENIDSPYAAMYHPWLQCYDSLLNKNSFMPPSGSVAGIYGRTDNSRGVHKAPANEVVRNCTGLSVNYNEAEQGKLNPKGINLIRALPGQGIRVWGARTCSSDGNWKYVNVKRLFIYIEESIKVNTGWAVFEPNDEMLWSRIEGTIRVFLTGIWRNGALAGSTADEAFFINIGASTMTQDDILNGRLICVIGVAPVRPAEFIVFRITQKMETAQ